MTSDFKNLINSESKIFISLMLLVCFLPSILMTGSAILNILCLLIGVIFLSELTIKKKISFIIKDDLFIIIFLFWLTLIINLFFSIDFANSFSRSFGFLRFIILVFAIKYVITYKKFAYKDFIFKIWLLIFLIISLDLFFEIVNGHNILGYSNNFPGRLSGFLNDELKIGNYYSGFVLLAICGVLNFKKNLTIALLVMIIFLIISLYIGERSNFIKTLIISFLFIFLLNKKDLLKKIVFIFSFLLISLTIILNNDSYKNRFFEQLVHVKYAGKQHNFIAKIKQYSSESHYYNHYFAAFEIWKSNKYFGIGLKNFRNESSKAKYQIQNSENPGLAWATHPHQIHFEFLAETGLFGYMSFLIFFLIILIKNIKSFNNKKNQYQLAGMLFILASLIPVMPSGSFFTSYSATIFWINFAVMSSFSERRKS